jgi:hypothetical protein
VPAAADPGLTEVSAVDDPPTTPLELPYLASSAPSFDSENVSGLGETAVAEIVGRVEIPQIRVGSPSPSGEPVAIGPDFRSFPFRPDVVIDGWSTDGLTVRGVTQRGHLHRYNGAPRQDDFAVHQVSRGRVIVVVADGVSAAPHSHLGASAAVKQAASWLRDHLGDDIAQTDWATLMKNVAWELNEQAQNLFQLPGPDPVRAEKELATTLLCAVIEPRGSGLSAHLVGVGDSGAWLLSAGNFSEIIGGKALSDSVITSSAVASLPRVPLELSPVDVGVGQGEVLLIGTDGIGDPLGSGQGGVGNLLRELLGASSPPSLIEFAHAVDFSREMFDDDRTLVAVWPTQRDSVRYGESELSGGIGV